MPNIVILGSCQHTPYKVLVPKKIPNAWNTERGYQIAASIFYPAIDKADCIIIWIPKGKIGTHTSRDLNYAIKQKKRIIIIGPNYVREYDYKTES